ncbi:hypothetical protein [Mucilaginibacter pocheonensis]|uniref:Restriction endonuclease n=1 Tax=Mucilaginibacter pocheonensis TaxID=398050 RepID=A0ABU1TAP5_9SPHI|nr:hypothetical protein [Mucilaginibacter pocheonensis]MDR6941941.1 hypothetical protein [Mucilaginibacter pocheonensis]
MIISANPTPELSEFNQLLKNTVIELNNQPGSSKEKIANLSGTKLEQYATDLMKSLAIGTPFENSIVCTPGQSFPDIIAKQFYGVEVKTTIKNHWKTTGNSVLESSRLEGVERIFLLFGKLADPVQFKYRPYEECLAEVVVTHSPRYLIDMNLAVNQTIFDKMTIGYDDLRRRPNPIREITNYYKNGLKRGDELWWLDQTEPLSSNIVIRLWSNLSKTEREIIKIKAFAYFPELLSNSNAKFSRLSMWLVTTQGVVCPSLRDTFTGGGRINIKTNFNTYIQAPRILYNLFQHLSKIKDIILNTPTEELSKYWEFNTSDLFKISDWIKLIRKASLNLDGISKSELLKFIEDLT